MRSLLLLENRIPVAEAENSPLSSIEKGLWDDIVAHLGQTAAFSETPEWDAMLDMHPKLDLSSRPVANRLLRTEYTDYSSLNPEPYPIPETDLLEHALAGLRRL